MATRVFTTNNYLTVDIPGENDNLRDHKSKVFINIIANDSNGDYLIKSEFIGSRKVFLSDLTDESGTPYTLSTWTEFYTRNSGFNTVVGGSATGWQDFADTVTDSTPLVQSNISGGSVQLTNNASGNFTDGNTIFNLETTLVDNNTGVPVNDTWDSSSNTIQFKDTGLKVNDNILARVHVKVSPNIVPQNFKLLFEFYDDVAGGGNFIFPLSKHLSEVSTNSGAYTEYIQEIRFFIGASILDGSCKISVVGESAFEIKVVGFNFLIIRK